MAAAFACTDEAISWDGRVLEAEALAEARTRFCHSFGSCSFDEPIDELAALRWLPLAPTTSPPVSEESE